MEDETEVMDDYEFFRRYESYEMEAATEFITRYCRTESELRESIDFLIRHREMMRDVEINRLEAEAQALVDKCNQLREHKLLEEIRCFKDILALQKQLLGKNGNSGN